MDDVELPGRGPQYQGCPPVGPLERAAFVAGRLAEMLLVGLFVIQCPRGRNLIVVKDDGSPRLGRVVRAEPSVRRLDPVVDLDHLEVFRLSLARPSTAPHRGRAPGLRNGHHREPHDTVRAFGCRDQHAGNGRVLVLEGTERQLRRRVPMGEREDDLHRPAWLGAPRPQRAGHRIDLRPVVRGVRWATGAADEVVHQRDAKPRAHGAELVTTVGVEGRPARAAEVPGCEVQDRLAVLVRHDQLTALVLGRKHDNQGGEHAADLLRVAMFEEEPAGLVDEQLVELRVHLPVRAEPGGCVRHDPVQRRAPPGVIEVDCRGRYLSAPTHGGVDQRVGPTAVGRGGGESCQRLCLSPRDGEAKAPEPVDVRADHRKIDGPGRKKFARVLHRGEEAGQRGGDVVCGHGGGILPDSEAAGEGRLSAGGACRRPGCRSCGAATA